MELHLSNMASRFPIFGSEGVKLGGVKVSLVKLRYTVIHVVSAIMGEGLTAILRSRQQCQET